jgi:hypothetical protein
VPVWALEMTYCCAHTGVGDGNTMLKRRAYQNDFTHPKLLAQAGHRRYVTPFQRVIIWLGTIGIFLPYTSGETGKYAIALLFVPSVLALVILLIQGRRHLVACDIFMWLATLWMVAAKIGGQASQSGILFQTASDALALIGSYTLARSYLYGELSLKEFTNVLKVVAVVLVALSVLDTLSGTFFIKQFMAGFFDDPRPAREDAIQTYRMLFGDRVIRAESTFEHPIQYGTFCAVAAAIFIYTERARRIFYCGVCFFGVILSLSSVAIIAFVIVVSVYLYDQSLRFHFWRWKIIFLTAAAIGCALYISSDDPISWPIRHLTIDPQTGFYRLMIWHSAFDQIGRSPIVGTDPTGWYTNDILSNSIDCVWLVLSLSYGLPMVVLLLLAILSSCGLFRKKINYRALNREILQFRTAFSLALFLFTFVGLTVHFWGALWMFWGLCIGIRASLEEYCSTAPFSFGNAASLPPRLAEGH